MSKLLDKSPYSERDEIRFLAEANELTLHHINGCPQFSNIWPGWNTSGRIEDLPFLHVGTFKHVNFKTQAHETRFERILKSSATTSSSPSLIHLDAKSSELQGRSSSAILRDFLGEEKRPLLVLDSSKSLLQRGEVSARVAAAMSLRPLASDIVFLLDQAEDPTSLNWQRLQCTLESHENLIIYGFTWILWLAWGQMRKPPEIRKLLEGKNICFVHSGGWKKLESLSVRHEELGRVLLQDLASGSRVIDFYGLVEQIGIIYPLCEFGYRHVPRWADVIIRDPFTLESLPDMESGMLQLINTLAWGAPYHSVLTEDHGRIIPGQCPCGRSGKRFELLGRVPKAEVRGCANV